MKFSDLKKPIHLYAGDVPKSRPDYDRITGLSLSYDDDKHIRHDIRHNIPLLKESVESYQSESVMEYIDWWEWPRIFSEVHRVLVRGGLFRLSVPDYRAEVLRNRCQYNASGAVCYDPGGGVDVRWFPTVEPALWLCHTSLFGMFGQIRLMHGICVDRQVVMHDIDYSRGWISRTPDNDARARDSRRVLSLVIDMIKT